MSVLDCRGEKCPLPVIKAAQRLSGLNVGDELVLLADDPAARTDVPAWCRMRGQELVEVTEEGTSQAYRIRKAGTR